MTEAISNGRKCIRATPTIKLRFFYFLQNVCLKEEASYSSYNGNYQEKIRGQRGTLPDQALGYVKFGKVIFRRPFATEV